MANLSKIEKQQKEIFNDLSIEEKKAYYKKLSEAKFSNYYFFSEEGILEGNTSKCKAIDEAVVDINKNPDIRTLCLNASLSVISDYETLKEKYHEELLVAFNFYYKSLIYNLTIIENLIYFLEEFSGVYAEEPSELLYTVLQDVAKSSVATFNKAIVIVNSVTNNISESDIGTGIEEFSELKIEIGKISSKYNDVLMNILNLEKPEGVNTNG